MYFGVAPENIYRPARFFGSGQSKPTDEWLWVRPNIPKLGMGPTDQTDVGIWARTNRPNSSMGQTEQADDGAWARPNRSNSGMGQTEQLDRIFAQAMSSVAPDALSATEVHLVYTCLGSRASS